MKQLFTCLLILALGMPCLATLSTTYAPDQYNTNGTNTTFTASWGFFSTSDLVVTHTDSAGTDTVLTEGSGTDKYSVYAANADYSGGATLTTSDTYPASGRITIERSVPYGQSLSINGDFVPAKPLETQLDKLAAQTQQILDEQGRTLTIPSTDASGLTTEFPNATTRALKLSGFDATGGVTIYSAVDSGTIVVDEVTITEDTNSILSVKALGIDTAQLAALAVDSTKLATNSVTTYSILDGDVTTAKIDDEAITLAKMADLTARTLIGNVTGASATPTAVVIIDDDTLATATTNNISTSESVKAYVDSAPNYTPSSYAGEESITFPNGLIMKIGTESGTSGTATFTADFSTVLSLVITPDNATQTTASYDTLSVSNFNWQIGGGNGISWQAIGY